MPAALAKPKRVQYIGSRVEFQITKIDDTSYDVERIYVAQYQYTRVDGTKSPSESRTSNFYRVMKRNETHTTDVFKKNTLGGYVKTTKGLEVELTQAVDAFVSKNALVLPVTNKKDPRKMTQVLKDAHSIYVITKGEVYRPVFPPVYSEAYESGSTATEGSNVIVSSKVDGPLLNLATEDGTKEIWFHHGDANSPSKAWKPTNYLVW